MNSRKANAIRLAVLAATTLVVAACGGGGGGNGGGAPQPPMNSAPSITGIDDRSADQDTVLTIDFGIDDRDTGAGSLTVGAAAGGTVFPTDGVVLSGTGATRTLTLTPFESTTGTANITIQVSDPQGASTTRSFAVAVNARNNSLRAMALEAFAKGENDTPTTLNGWTIQQDADDPATFAGLIPAEEPPETP